MRLVRFGAFRLDPMLHQLARQGVPGLARHDRAGTPLGNGLMLEDVPYPALEADGSNRSTVNIAIITRVRVPGGSPGLGGDHVLLIFAGRFDRWQ